MKHGKFDDPNLEHNRAPAYALLFRWATEVANQNGYALALHGSMKRDLDMIACPWTDEAIEDEKLVHLIADAVGGYVDMRLVPDRITGKNYIPRPHGRKAWVIQLGEGYIDISVMPRVEAGK